MINLEMGTDEVVIKVEFINFYRFYIADSFYDMFESSDFFRDNITGRYLEVKVTSYEDHVEMNVGGYARYYRDGEKVEDIVNVVKDKIFKLTKADRSYEKIEFRGNVTTIKLELYKSKINKEMN